MPQSEKPPIEKTISRAKKAAKQGNAKLASQLFQAALRQQPNHPVAKKALRKLQTDLSKILPEDIAEVEPVSDQVVALIRLYRSGQISETIRSCKEVLQAFPRSATVLNVLGAALQVQGKFHEAVQAFDEAIRLQPDFAECYCNRGNAQKRLGQWDEALASYDRSIRLKPDYADAHSNLGNGLMDLGRLDEAMASYRRALEIDPEYAEAHNNLGSTLRELERLDEAEKDIR